MLLLGAQCQIPQMPLLPNDAERHPAMVREYHAIAEEIQRECQHIALLDRMHSLKARPFSTQLKRSTSCS